MFITYLKDSKKVAYIGEKKPVSYTDNLALAEIEDVPFNRFGNYIYNEETNTVEQVSVSAV